jgi:hypothetical protein
MFLLTQTPQLLLIGILAATHAFRRPAQQAPGAASAEAQVPVPVEDRLNMAASYFGLAVFLATAAFLSHRLLSAAG